MGKGKGLAPKKKNARPYVDPIEETRRQQRLATAAIQEKKKKMGDTAYFAEVNDRVRRLNEAAMESVREEEERKKKEKEIAQKRLERMDLDDQEDCSEIVDNDYVVTPPSPRTLAKNSGFGGPSTEFKDVRILDAQRDFNASSDSRRVLMVEKGKKLTGEEFISLPQEERDRLNERALEYQNRRNEKRREEARKESEKRREEAKKESDHCTSYEESSSEEDMDCREKEENEEKRSGEPRKKERAR